MKIENLRDKMLASHSDATTQEIECLETYHDEADKYGYFDTYYKVWSTEKIEKLEYQNKKLAESLKILANQMEGVGLAFKVHGLNLDAQFFIEQSYQNAETARAVLKEVENEGN